MGETDWKAVVIDVNDPLASSLNSMDDVDAKMPGFKEATREWFRIYKMPDGKPENVFGFEEASRMLHLPPRLSRKRTFFGRNWWVCRSLMKILVSFVFPVLM